MAQFLYMSAAHAVYCKTCGHELHGKKPDNQFHYTHFIDDVNASVHLKVTKCYTNIL